MKSFVSVVFLCLLSIYSFGQNRSIPIKIQASIIDSKSNATLPFATVFNKTMRKGTASNLEGYFELPNNSVGDTIVVSYLGYEDEEFILDTKPPKQIKLKPRSALLDEIVIVAENSFLYELVSKLRKNKSTKTKTAKTYFFLETQLFNEPVEIIESYYNGQYADYGTKELSIKKGRIGLKPVNKRHYRSTESSKLFSVYDAFDQSHYFPDNPLSFKKKELKKRYRLKLNHSYEENGNKIFVIDFTPREDKRSLFSGRIWVNQDKNRVVKLKLGLQNASVHPFKPLGFNTIEEVDMAITKTYQIIDGEPFVNNIDFNYNVFYVDKWGNNIKAVTKVFTKAYDYESEFRLPNFEFSPHLHEDYRNMTAVPYDSTFWNKTNEFRFYDRAEEVENFILENKLDNGVMHPRTRKDSTRYQLQFPYIRWDEKRFKMNQPLPELVDQAQRNTAFELDRFKFGVKLYMDINTVEDSVIYQLKTIIDPVETYYYFYIDSTDLAFMNMNFDLMEIQKRKLIKDIQSQTELTEDLLSSLHKKHVNEFHGMSESFINEVDRARHKKKTKKWNKYILEELAIDNIKIYKLFEEDKKINLKSLMKE